MMATGRFKWLSAMVAVMVLVMVSAAFADDLPRTAVYVTGDLGENEKKALGTRILVNLFNSGRYRSAERAAHFLAEADKERQTRGAAMDDGHISELGKRFDINSVCVVDVTPVLGEFQISARMVNVETAATELIGAAASPLKSLSDLEQVSELVVKNMFSAQAASTAEAETAQKITIEPEAESIAQASASAPMPADMPPIETSPSPPKGPLKAAVYVTGIPPMVAKPFNSAISSALIKSKIYAGIEPIEVSGAPSVPTLADAGKNAGVSYIFTINVAGQISVAIIDVAGSTELAKISIDGKITAVSAAVIAKKIVDFILTSGPKPDPDALVAEETAPGQSVGYEPNGKPRRLEKRIRLETGYALSLVRYGGWSSNMSYHKTYMDYNMNQWYLKSDAIYSEISAVLGDKSYEDEVQLLAKYPIDIKNITVFPLLSVDYYENVNNTYFKIGGGIDIGLGKTSYLRSKMMYRFETDNVLSALLIDLEGGIDTDFGTPYLLAELHDYIVSLMYGLGIGYDIGFGKRRQLYLCTVFMYNMYNVSDYMRERFEFDFQESFKFSFGAGYKFGGKK